MWQQKRAISSVVLPVPTCVALKSESFAVSSTFFFTYVTFTYCLKLTTKLIPVMKIIHTYLAICGTECCWNLEKFAPVASASVPSTFLIVNLRVPCCAQLFILLTPKPLLCPVVTYRLVGGITVEYQEINNSGSLNY